MAELYGTLQKAIWSELTSGASISMMRRNLQREHVRLLSEAVARASSRTPADAAEDGDDDDGDDNTGGCESMRSRPAT